MISFFAEGLPKGQPRPKAFVRAGRASVYDPGTAEGWKGQVALAAREHRPAAPIDGPVQVALMFRFPRPKSHYRSGARSGQLKPEAPAMHTGKPDADNVAKAILDAINHLGFWRDDSQVAVLKVRKCYGDAPSGCQIEIKQVTQ